MIGEPIEVVADATEPQLEAARLLLEQRLAALEDRARDLVGSGYSRTDYSYGFHRQYFPTLQNGFREQQRNRPASPGRDSQLLGCGTDAAALKQREHYSERHKPRRHHVAPNHPFLVLVIELPFDGDKRHRRGDEPRGCQSSQPEAEADSTAGVQRQIVQRPPR